MDYPWHSTYTVLQAGSITGTFDESNLRSYYAFCRQHSATTITG